MKRAMKPYIIREPEQGLVYTAKEGEHGDEQLTRVRLVDVHRALERVLDQGRSCGLEGHDPVDFVPKRHRRLRGWLGR
jgi:hypothetical protein